MNLAVRQHPTLRPEESVCTTSLHLLPLDMGLIARFLRSARVSPLGMGLIARISPIAVGPDLHSAHRHTDPANLRWTPARRTTSAGGWGPSFIFHRAPRHRVTALMVCDRSRHANRRRIAASTTRPASMEAQFPDV